MIDWFFATLVGTRIAYAILKKSEGQTLFPFDFEMWSNTWAPGAVGAFLGCAAGQLLAIIVLH